MALKTSYSGENYMTKKLKPKSTGLYSYPGSTPSRQ